MLKIFLKDRGLWVGFRRQLTVHAADVGQVELVLPSVLRLLENVANLSTNPRRPRLGRILQGRRSCKDQLEVDAS